MSDDFTWQPESPSRRALRIRVAVVLACAGIGITAGSYYPIKMLVTAFERASLPRVSARGNLPSPTAMDATRESFTPVAEMAPPPSTEAKQRPPEVSGRPVLLNPGSAEQSPPPEQPESRPSAEPPPLEVAGDERVMQCKGAATGPGRRLIPA